MSKRHGAREQKRLAKQKAKRDDRRRDLARRTSSNPVHRFQSTEHWPVVACLVPDDLWDTGMGTVAIARKMPDGELAVAGFLLDVFCLGVKDAFWRITPPEGFREVRESIEREQSQREVSPEYFAKLVYQTADYGQSLGFPPPHDFRHAQRLLAGIDPSECKEEFKFGHNGRPLFIAGPYDSPGRIQMISDRVARHGGHLAVGISSDDVFVDLPGEGEELDDDVIEGSWRLDGRRPGG